MKVTKLNSFRKKKPYDGSVHDLKWHMSAGWAQEALENMALSATVNYQSSTTQCLVVWNLKKTSLTAQKRGERYRVTSAKNRIIFIEHKSIRGFRNLGTHHLQLKVVYPWCFTHVTRGNTAFLHRGHLLTRSPAWIHLRKTPPVSISRIF